MSMDIMQHYHNARSRLFLLDYDGTLVPFAPTPEAAQPTPELLELLAALSADSANTVSIISGRDQHSLADWLGHLPLGLSAEHGLYHRHPGGDWVATRPISHDWKPPVRRLMEAAKLPGAHIEEKTMSLVWHYRQADPEAGHRAAAALIKELSTAAPNLKIMPGHQIVEVTASGTHKGDAARYWLEAGEYDFVLAAGDDTTDHDLFAALPDTAHRVWVEDPASFTGLLRDLVH
jgi:trehalose 6-phosphate synthase/phosphatase